MDANLLDLIVAFEEDTARAVRVFLSRADLQHPFAWREAGLPRIGRLDGDPRVRYAFHSDGRGLRLRIGGEMIELEFGLDGRTGGFNEYWLGEYAEHRLSRFGFYQQHRTWLRRAFDAAIAAGEVARRFSAQQDTLYYRVAGSDKQLFNAR